MRFFAVLILSLMLLCGCGSKEDLTGDVTVISPDDVSLEAGNSEDGSYTVAFDMEGGSGKAYVVSPAQLEINEGKYTVRLEWSSSNYDYMIFDGVKYLPVNTEGPSVFEIPLDTLDEPLTMIADTTAMSKPHEVEYVFVFDSESIMPAGEYRSEENKEEDLPANGDIKAFSGAPHEAPCDGLKLINEMERKYAECFRVFYYEGGYKEFCIVDGRRMLLVPEGAEVPEDIDESVIVLKAPLNDIYLVSTAAMDYFDAIDEVERLRFASLKEGEWGSDKANAAMQTGALLYAGKYSAPDYELLMNKGCRFVIENTMILHSPQVLEKLESLGFAAMVDHSSYEEHPLGRTEWVRFYGALFDKEDEADKAFGYQLKESEELDISDGKSVLIFYFTSSGLVSVKNDSEYLAKMVSLCGGEYGLRKSGKATGTTETLSQEAFFDIASDTDILIYNTTIAGDNINEDELVRQFPLFNDLKAVKDGRFYLMTADSYKHPMAAGDMMREMCSVFKDDTAGLTYFRKYER